jgi:hypothetical protein
MIPPAPCPERSVSSFPGRQHGRCHARADRRLADKSLTVKRPRAASSGSHARHLRYASKAVGPRLGCGPGAVRNSHSVARDQRRGTGEALRDSVTTCFAHRQARAQASARDFGASPSDRRCEACPEPVRRKHP